MGHIRSGAGGINDVEGVPQAGCKNLGRKSVIVVNPANGLDQFHSDMPDIVQSPEKRADIGRSGLRRQQRLVRGEA